MAIDALELQATGAWYEANVSFEAGLARTRWWAFPLLGGIARFAVCIPHFIILIVLALLFTPAYGLGTAGTPWGGLGLMFLIVWFPVLFGGLMPSWAYGLAGGYLRWSNRVAAFVLGLTDVYPPFTMHLATHPVEVTISMPGRNNRWWAFPLLGFYIKLIVLLPHWLCIAGIGVAAMFLYFTMWIPVLITGRYPQAPYGLMCSWLRWILRVSAYQGGLTDKYPPFSLR